MLFFRTGELIMVSKKQHYIIISVIVLIILIACNLRASITGVGSLINTISGDLGLSAGTAGMLTTIPLLSFAAISPIVVLAAEKLGAGRLFIISSFVLSAGILIRSCCGQAGLFIGTVIIGMGIAVGNVLLPAVIKSIFPNRIESMTSLYTVIMQAVSAVSTAVSVPIALVMGWKAALGIWIFPALAALICCIANRRLDISQGADEGTVCGSSADGAETPTIYGAKSTLLKKGMTWWITSYMGVQSMMFYCFIAWLSPIMQSKGYSDIVSGYFLSVYVIMGIIGSAFLSFIMKRNKSQSSTGILLGILYLTGMICMLFSSWFFALAAGILLCGFCSGTCISFSMALFGLHTSNGNSASKLSGIAQSAGYLLAAAGPVLLGKVFDISGNWTFCMLILVAAAVYLIISGRIVGREEIVE